MVKHNHWHGVGGWGHDDIGERVDDGNYEDCNGDGNGVRNGGSDEDRGGDGDEDGEMRMRMEMGMRKEMGMVMEMRMGMEMEMEMEMMLAKVIQPVPKPHINIDGIVESMCTYNYIHLCVRDVCVCKR